MWRISTDLYGDSMLNVGACTVSMYMYQALSPPLKGTGYEANLCPARGRAT